MTNDDEVCIPSFSSILLAVPHYCEVGFTIRAFLVEGVNQGQESIL